MPRPGRVWPNSRAYYFAALGDAPTTGGMPSRLLSPAPNGPARRAGRGCPAWVWPQNRTSVYHFIAHHALHRFVGRYANVAVEFLIFSSLVLVKLEPWAAHQLTGAAGKGDVVTVAGSMALKVPRKYLPAC